MTWHLVSSLMLPICVKRKLQIKSKFPDVVVCKHTGSFFSCWCRTKMKQDSLVGDYVSMVLFFFSSSCESLWFFLGEKSTNVISLVTDQSEKILTLISDVFSLIKKTS